MTEKKDNRSGIRIKIPTVGDLESRFSFVHDDTLRQNIAVAFQYVIFLTILIEKEKLEESTISSSIYKDMITHTATVVRSCLRYCLKEFFLKKKSKDAEFFV